MLVCNGLVAQARSRLDTFEKSHRQPSRRYILSPTRARFAEPFARVKWCGRSRARFSRACDALILMSFAPSRHATFWKCSKANSAMLVGEAGVGWRRQPRLALDRCAGHNLDASPGMHGQDQKV